jgi:hypothetical protein
MVATLTHNRIGRDSPVPVRRELPTSQSGRKELWGDAVLEAVMALREQLNSRNEQIVAAAANSILELERTRMRHDKLISGTDPSAVQSTPVEADDPERLEEHVLEIRDHMKRVVGRPISVIEAKEYVVEKITNWGVRANQIHPGEFVKVLGLMNELPEVETVEGSRS